MVRKSLIYANNALILATVHLVVSERAELSNTKSNRKWLPVITVTLHDKQWINIYICSRFSLAVIIAMV